MMSEKTLVQVFQEELAKASNNAHDLSGSSERLNWWLEMALNAVIEANEARKLQTPKEL